MRPDKPLTHLQRAFKVFEAMNPNPLSSSHLATIMVTTPGCAVLYIRRLREAGCVKRIGGSTRYPLYGLAESAVMPPDDRRGGARSRGRSRASRPISQITAARLKT